MAAAGCPDLTITDVLVLHHICHRARNKKLGDICFVLNVEDTHVVGYSLKKLLAAGLAQGEKVGKEVFYSPTAGRRGGGREVPRGARGLPDRQPRRRPQHRHRRGGAPAAHDVGPVRPGGAGRDLACDATSCDAPADPRRPHARHALPAPRRRHRQPGDVRVPGAPSRSSPARRRAGSCTRPTARCSRRSSTPRRRSSRRRLRRDLDELRLPGAVPEELQAARDGAGLDLEPAAAAPAAGGAAGGHAASASSPPMRVADARRICRRRRRRGHAGRGPVARFARSMRRCSTIGRELDAGLAEAATVAAALRLRAPAPEARRDRPRMHQHAALR